MYFYFLGRSLGIVGFLQSNLISILQLHSIINYFKLIPVQIPKSFHLLHIVLLIFQIYCPYIMQSKKYLHYFIKPQNKKYTPLNSASTNSNLCPSGALNQLNSISNSVSSFPSSNNQFIAQKNYPNLQTANQQLSNKKRFKRQTSSSNILKYQNYKLSTKALQKKGNPSHQQGNHLYQQTNKPYEQQNSSYKKKSVDWIDRQKYQGNTQVIIGKKQHKIINGLFRLSKTQMNRKKTLVLQSEPLQPIRPYHRNKTAPNKKFKTMKTTFGDLNSSCKNYNDHYTMSLQNLRMGWRILNTRSMVEEYRHNPHFLLQIYNGKFQKRVKTNIFSKGNKKANEFSKERSKNVIKAFFKGSNLSRKQQSRRLRLVQSFSQKHHNCENVLIDQGKGRSPSRQCRNTDLNNFFEDHSKKVKKLKSNLKPSFFKDEYFRQNPSFNRNNFMLANKNFQSFSHEHNMSPLCSAS